MTKNILLALIILCSHGFVFPAESSNSLQIISQENVCSLKDLCLNTIAYRTDLHVYGMSGTFDPEATVDNLSDTLKKAGLTEDITDDKDRLRCAVRMPHIRHAHILKLFFKYDDGTYVFNLGCFYRPADWHESDQLAKVLPLLLDDIQSNNISERECNFLLKDRHELITNALQHIERLSLLQNNIKFHFNQLIPSTHVEHLKLGYQQQKDALIKTVESALLLVNQRAQTLTAQCAIISELCTTYNIQERSTLLREEALRERARREQWVERERQHQAEREMQYRELLRQETAQRIQDNEQYMRETENKATANLLFRVVIPTALAGLAGSAYLITNFDKPEDQPDFIPTCGPLVYWGIATLIDLNNLARTPNIIPIHIATGFTSLLPTFTNLFLRWKASQG